MATKPFGDDPVDEHIDKKDPSLLEEWLLNKGNEYTTTDDETFDSRDDARDHQRKIDSGN